MSIDQVPVRVSDIVMAGNQDWLLVNHNWFLVNRDSVNVMLISWDHYMMDDVLDDLDGMGHCMVQRCLNSSVVNDWGFVDWVNMVNDWRLVNLSMMYWSCMMDNWL